MVEPIGIERFVVYEIVMNVGCYLVVGSGGKSNIAMVQRHSFRNLT